MVTGVFTAPRVAAFISAAAGSGEPGAVGAALAGGTSIVGPATVVARLLWLWVPLWLRGPRPLRHLCCCYRLTLRARLLCLWWGQGPSTAFVPGSASSPWSSLA